MTDKNSTFMRSNHNEKRSSYSEEKKNMQFVEVTFLHSPVSEALFRGLSPPLLTYTAAPGPLDACFSRETTDHSLFAFFCLHLLS